ncbi:MAG: MBL fold metallo-hydrolase [Planctomycetota bacterium]
MNFIEIKSGDVVQIGKIVVKSDSFKPFRWTLGYKIVCENRSIAYISDHEHTEKSKQGLVDFLMNTNLVIFDTHYTSEEYSGSDGCGGRKGWGYSTWKYAVALCREANVGQLTLTHHGHEDVEIEKIELEVQKEFSNTIAAYEGLEIDLG